MDNNTYTDSLCHTCFESDSKKSLVSIMLGMTVCFSTLWRFPYQTANFGGAGYVFTYLAIVALFVYPALTAEWGLGRLTRRGHDGAFKNVGFPQSRLVSIFLFGVILAIASYFAIWIGWIVKYAFASLFDGSLVKPSTNSADYFDRTTGSQPLLQIAFAAVVMLSVAPVVLKGQKRIQKVSNIVVPVFYIIIIAMTAFVLSQPGVFSSTSKYLITVKSDQITSYTILAALGQAFFSLCLGGTFMVLYGSYMEKKDTHSIPVNASLTVIGNTIASLISVFLIIGIVNLAGLQGNLGSFGPELFFGTIPEAFQAIDANSMLLRIGMFAFFVMFFFAAYLPMTAIIEVGTVSLVDQFGWTRRKAYSIFSLLALLLAIPSAMSPYSGGFLYNLDIFVGASGLVMGSMLAMTAFMWFVPKDRVLAEVNSNTKLKMGKIWYAWTKYVTPLFMLLVFLYALSDVLAGTTTSLSGVNDSDYILYERIVSITPFVIITTFVISIILFAKDKQVQSPNSVIS